MKTWFSLKLPEIRCSSVDYSTLSPSPTSYFIRFQTHCEFTEIETVQLFFYILGDKSICVFVVFVYSSERF